MSPKGNLLIIGGAEDIGDDVLPDEFDRGRDTKRLEILMGLLHASRNKKIEIITTATRIHNVIKARYQQAFRLIGYPDPGFMPITNKFEARDEQYLKRAGKAGAIFFTGGDQFRLSTILGGTPIVDLIKERYCKEKNFLVAGTSAGAMAMSDIMISGGGMGEVPKFSDLLTTSGLGFLRNCIVDTHFIRRGRFSRLAHAIIINPGHLGIGLGEDTALIIKNGSETECRGSGSVIIVDGRHIGQTNIPCAKEGDSLFVENLTVHILVKGCRFSILTRKLYRPAMNPKDK